MRCCLWCWEPLVKREGESPWKFRKRQHCNHACGALDRARPLRKLPRGVMRESLEAAERIRHQQATGLQTFKRCQCGCRRLIGRPPEWSDAQWARRKYFNQSCRVKGQRPPLNTRFVSWHFAILVALFLGCGGPTEPFHPCFFADTTVTQVGGHEVVTIHTVGDCR